VIKATNAARDTAGRVAKVCAHFKNTLFKYFKMCVEFKIRHRYI
jgi:hypothetical protein